MTTLTQLERASLAELEAMFVAPPAHGESIAVPRGLFHGVFLQRVESPGAQRRLWWWVDELGFRRTSFGVDFDRRAWFFVHRRLRTGGFTPVVQRSRWRDTEAVALHYQGSRLPGRIKRLLYDEIKPLSDDLLLGLGGINAERGQGDHFFFALRRR